MQQPMQNDRMVEVLEALETPAPLLELTYRVVQTQAEIAEQLTRIADQLGVISAHLNGISRG